MCLQKFTLNFSVKFVIYNLCFSSPSLDILKYVKVISYSVETTENIVRKLDGFKGNAVVCISRPEFSCTGPLRLMFVQSFLKDCKRLNRLPSEKASGVKKPFITH